MKKFLIALIFMIIGACAFAQTPVTETGTWYVPAGTDSSYYLNVASAYPIGISINYANLDDVDGIITFGACDNPDSTSFVVVTHDSIPYTMAYTNAHFEFQLVARWLKVTVTAGSVTEFLPIYYTVTRFR